MAKYIAIFMHGKRSGEGRYEFDGDEKLLENTPVRIMRAFMKHIENQFAIGHIDYQINAAIKNQQQEIVTVIGEIMFESGDHQPFMCMISHYDKL
ncbi:MAG: hypothetical protein AAFW82_03305 [Pseudomonadota bacterium]